MTDELIPTPGVIRIISKQGHTTNALVADGQKALTELAFALRTGTELVRDNSGDHRNDLGGVYLLDAMDDKNHPVPALIVLADVAMVILFPPPSAITIPRPDIKRIQ